MSDDHLRLQLQIQALYEMQKEQWVEYSNNLNQYKKELNAQHAVMKERMALHEDSLKQTLKEIRAQLSDSRAALDVLRARP